MLWNRVSSLTSNASTVTSCDQALVFRIGFAFCGRTTADARPSPSRWPLYMKDAVGSITMRPPSVESDDDSGYIMAGVCPSSDQTLQLMGAGQPRNLSKHSEAEQAGLTWKLVRGLQQPEFAPLSGTPAHTSRRRPTPCASRSLFLIHGAARRQMGSAEVEHTVLLRGAKMGHDPRCCAR